MMCEMEKGWEPTNVIRYCKRVGVNKSYHSLNGGLVVQRQYRRFMFHGGFSADYLYKWVDEEDGEQL